MQRLCMQSNDVIHRVILHSLSCIVDARNCITVDTVIVSRACLPSFAYSLVEGNSASVGGLQSALQTPFILLTLLTLTGYLINCIFLRASLAKRY